MVNSNVNALGVIFANTYDNLVPELVAERSMASIPFGGRYRLIDFTLSSMANAGIDNVSVVMPTEAIASSLYTILGEIQKEVEPDSLTVHDQIAVVAAVGRKMAFRPGVSGQIFAALGQAGINIRMINQGPDELNIIFGVDNRDFSDAIRVLYNSFVK